MKLLLALTIVINSYAIVKEFQTGPLANQETFTILRTGLQPFKIFPLSPDERFRRNPPGDQLKDSIDKLEMISRLINVIYLEQGISNGTVFKSEELISELLRFGPVKPKNIQDIVLDKITKALDSVKQLPKQLQKNDNLEAVFERVGDILRAMGDNQQAAKWDGKDAYKKDMESIRDGNVTLPDTSNLKAQLGMFTAQSKSVATQEVPEIRHAGFLENLKKAAEGVRDETKSLNVKVFKFASTATASDAIKKFVQVGTALKSVMDNSMVTSPVEKDSLEKNMEQASSSLSQISSSEPELANVRDLYYSRFYQQSTTFEYTPGLSNGFDDVGKVSNSFQNPWLKDLVNGSSLKASYPSLMSFGNSISVIQKPLGKPDKNKFEVISGILKDVKQLKIFDGVSIKDANTVLSCFEGMTMDTGVSGVVEDLQQSAKKIDNEMSRLNLIIKKAYDILESQKNSITTIIETISGKDLNNLEAIRKTFSDLSKNGFVTGVADSLSKLDLEDLKVENLKRLATESLTHLGKVDTFQNKAQKFFANIDCVMQKENAPKLVAAVRELKSLRSSQKGFTTKYDNGLEYVKNVASTKNGLTSLQGLIASSKGKVSLESSLLNLLEQADVHSKNLGLATRGVANMKTLIDRKADFAVFKAQSNLVKSEAKKHSNEFNQDESKLLDELAALGGSIDTMYTDLVKWETGIAAVDSSNLENYSELFSTIKDAKELPEDLSTMTQVLQKLIESVEAENQQSPSINSLRMVKAALITLDGLHFSNYLASSDKVKESLSVMKSFFIEYAKAEIMKRSATASPQIKKVFVTGRPEADIEKVKAETNILIIIIVCCGAFIGLIFTAIVIYCCCCRKKKDDLILYEPLVVELYLAVLFQRAWGTQIVKIAKKNEGEKAKLLKDCEKRKNDIREAELAALKTCPVFPAQVEAKDRKTAAGDEEETARTSTSFLEELRNAQDVDPEVSESSDDGDNEVRNMAGGNEEEIEDNSDSEGVNRKDSESSEEEEIREMAGGIKEKDENNSDAELLGHDGSGLSEDEEVREMAGGNQEEVKDNSESEVVGNAVSEVSEEEIREIAGGMKEEHDDNSDPGIVDVEVSDLSDEEARDKADQEFRLLAGGNKKKNNASVNLTIKKDAVKTPAKSKEPTTPKTPEGPKPEAKSNASADPKVSADPKEAVVNKASTGDKEASATPKLPEKVNAPSTSPAAVNKVESDTRESDFVELIPPENEKMPVPIEKLEDSLNSMDDEFENKKIPADDLSKKSDEELAAEVMTWGNFTFAIADRDLNEANKPKDVNKIVDEHRRESREDIYLNEPNMIVCPTKTNWKRGRKGKKGITFKTSFFHGNIARFKNGFRVIACQGPIVGKQEGLDPTVEKFYYVAKVNGVRAVLMLCNFVEPVLTKNKKTNKYELQDKTKCDVYFPLEENDVMNFTGFTVTCLKKTVEGDLITRELAVAYDGEEPFELTHYQYVGWPDKSAPKNAAELARIWMTIRERYQTITVHCSAGIGRTGTVLLIEEIYQLIHYSNKASTGTGKIDFGLALRNVRKYRARAVQSALQFIFGIMVVFEMLFANVKHETKSGNPPPEPKPGMETISLEDYNMFSRWRFVWELLRPDPPAKAAKKKEGDNKSVVKAANGAKSKEETVDAKKSVVKAADGQKSKEKTAATKKSVVKEPTAGKKK